MSVRGRWLSICMILMMLILTSIKVQAASVDQISAAKRNVVTGGVWEEDAAGKRYKQQDGTYLSDTWVVIDQEIYSFTKAGVVRTGWFTVKSKQYYAQKDGKVQVKSLLKIGRKTYYFQKDGTPAKEKWVKYKGKYRYFNAKGVMQTKKLITTKGKTYYVNASGVRVTKKWVKIKKIKYYFDKKGVMTKRKFAGKSQKYVFVGDSRTVGMRNSVSSSAVAFIGKIGAGYSYLSGTGGGNLRSYLARNKKSNVHVIFGFGVNDVGNISQYINYYRSFKNSYPNVMLHFMSVNPVNDSAGWNVSNSMIRSFNARLRSAFPMEYLDTYSFVLANMQTIDGLHYTIPTYQLLYQHVVKKIS